MGWNSWATFQKNINESLISDMTYEIVSRGMRDAGYTYVVIDDGYTAANRDSKGQIVVDSAKFPSGILPLSKYAHV